MEQMGCVWGYDKNKIHTTQAIISFAVTFNEHIASSIKAVIQVEIIHINLYLHL